MEVNVKTDAEGYLVDRDEWDETIATALAANDDFEMTDDVMAYILKAREMYEHNGVVPPIRKFAREAGVSTKALYDIFHKGPMKLICKWGGLPKPTGCV